MAGGAWPAVVWVVGLSSLPKTTSIYQLHDVAEAVIARRQRHAMLMDWQ